LLLRSIAQMIGPDEDLRSFRSRLDSVTRTSLLPFYDRYARYAAHFNGDERVWLYTPELMATLRAPTARSVMRDPYLASDAEDELGRLLDTDVHTYLPGDLLVKMDIASMAHSLEVRSPLLDHQLMELAASLPSAWKIDGQTTKRIFKDALRAWLPAEILDRPKQGFGVPLGEWLRGALRRLPEDILLDRRARERGWFRESAVTLLIVEHQEGIADHTNKLWALIQLELWLQTFIDARATAPATLSVGAGS
jgi:asparagine synthase (glutamine-hydrolysing)